LDNLTVGDELGDVLGCPSTTLAGGGSEMCSGNFTAPIVPCLYGVGVIASGNETGNIVGGLGEVNVTVSAASAPLTTPGGSVNLQTSAGNFSCMESVPESLVPIGNKPDGLIFPYGFFNFTVNQIKPGLR